MIIKSDRKGYLVSYNVRTGKTKWTLKLREAKSFTSQHEALEVSYRVGAKVQHTTEVTR